MTRAECETPRARVPVVDDPTLLLRVGLSGCLVPVGRSGILATDSTTALVPSAKPPYSAFMRKMHPAVNRGGRTRAARYPGIAGRPRQCPPPGAMVSLRMPGCTRA